jgi:hypothetical protein
MATFEWRSRNFDDAHLSRNFLLQRKMRHLAASASPGEFF